MAECFDDSYFGSGEVVAAAEWPSTASDAPYRGVGGGCGPPNSGHPSAAAAALLAIDDASEQKYVRLRAIEPEPFCAWSAPWRSSAAAAAAAVATTNGKKAAAGSRRAAAAAAARSGTLNEDEWLLRFRQPYWRAMVGRDGEYVSDNGCYRCMKLRSYPDDLDLFFGPGERPRAEPAPLRASSEPRQLQREVTRDLRRQFRLVVQGRESAASEPDAAAAAAAAAATAAADTSRRHSLGGIRHQPIAEAEGEDADADDPAASASTGPIPPPVELPVSVVRSGGGGHVAALGRSGLATSASMNGAFAPPATGVLYELPGGSLSFLDEYSAKDLVSLSRTLSRIPDFGSKMAFSEKLLTVERGANNGSDPRAAAAAAAQQALVKRSVPLPLPLPPAPPPMREAFVLADDALRVKKLSRRQDLRPVEKLTPKLRQLEDSTRLANTLARLRYTTASGNVISLPVFASSRSHSASLPADGDVVRAGAVGGTLAAAAATTAAAAAQPQSAPPSPDNKKKAKGRRAETKGFSLPENGIQEMCLPEIAGVRIAAFSGPHR